MKEEYLGRDNQKGFSTLEMLIAMAILIMVISAVILVSFGSQSLLIDSQTNNEALKKAQQLLEQQQSLARKDFKLVNPVTEFADGIYQEKVDVETQPDFFTKKVTATVSWPGEYNRNLSVKLSALVTNFNNALGGDTCGSVLSGHWENPQIQNLDFAQLVGDVGGPYPVSDIDASIDLNQSPKLYVTVNNTDVGDKETFFIFDITNPASPVLISDGKIDNDDSVRAGLNAVHAAGNYAYVASNYGANFNTETSPCDNSNGANPSCGQLQVIDISVSPPELKYTFEVPSVSGSGGQAIGKSIFYKDGYVYLGLAKTESGPEFNIIDVHNPLAPFPVGSWPVGNGINAIYVKGRYAYLATPNNQELIVLDISNPASPSLAGGFDAPGGSGNGKSLYLVGDTLYLGRTVGGTEFYILDDKIPATVQLPVFGEKSDIDDSINSIISRDYLTFLITNNQLQIFKINQASNPWGISPYFSISLPSDDNRKSMDCQGNYLYVGSVDSSDNGYLSIITSTP